MDTTDKTLSSSAPLLHKARQIARTVQEQGGRAFLVGGYVRDELLGLHPKDADLEVYKIEAETLLELLRRFGRVDCVGESFRVYKLVWHRRGAEGQTGQRYELDVALPRRDKKVGVGHRGFLVEGDPFATVEEAACRRDFTINAILRDPLTGEVLDPFGGQRDLKNKVLRVVDAQHFGEDSLRVLRAMQFAARFGMTLDEASVQLCRSIDLSDLPKERVWGEWEKMLLKAVRPAAGLQAARQLLILRKLSPALEVAMQREGEAICQTFDRAGEEKHSLTPERQITLMLAALAVFLERQDIEPWLDSFGLKTWGSYPVRDQVLALLANHHIPTELYEREATVHEGELRRVATRCEPRLLYHLTCARGQLEAAEWFRAQMARLEVLDGPPTPLLMGRHLLDMGLTPGPQIGEITRAVYELQLDGVVTTLDEAQEAAQKLMQSIP